MLGACRRCAAVIGRVAWILGRSLTRLLNNDLVIDNCLGVFKWSAFAVSFRLLLGVIVFFLLRLRAVLIKLLFELVELLLDAVLHECRAQNEASFNT